MPRSHTEQGGVRVRPPEDWELVGSSGARPFEDSAAVYRLADGSKYHWDARRHRKGRGPKGATGAAAATADFRPESKSENPWLEFYAPHRISWWVAVVFIGGSALFTIGACAALFGAVSGSGGSFTSDASYFVGAVLFTIGIYLQILEALNASDYIGLEEQYEPRHFTWFAWRPRRLEFTVPFVLLIGSVLFNFETSLALFGGGVQALIGVSSFVGSLLFVASTYLQLVEVCHGYLCLRPREISWWVAVFNLAGSFGFLVGSAFGFEVPGLSSPQESMLTTVSFLFGSVLFLVGSYLLLPEMFSE